MRDANDIKSDIKRAEAKLAKAEEHLVITQQRIDKRRASIERLTAQLQRAEEKPAPAEKKKPAKAAEPSKPSTVKVTKVSLKKNK